MKLILVLFLIIATFAPNLSWAQQTQDTKRLPFASELNANVKHYNRASSKHATSGTPSIGAFKELAEKGVKTFIDLRTQDDVTIAAGMEVEAAGATYYNIPVFGAQGISKEQVEEFGKIYEQADGLILVNCGSGNRVGALWAAYQMSKGVSHAVAIEEGRTAGMKITLEKDVTSKFCTEC